MGLGSELLWGQSAFAVHAHSVWCLNSASWSWGYFGLSPSSEEWLDELVPYLMGVSQNQEYYSFLGCIPLFWDNDKSCPDMLFQLTWLESVTASLQQMKDPKTCAICMKVSCAVKSAGQVRLSHLRESQKVPKALERSRVCARGIRLILECLQDCAVQDNLLGNILTGS